MNNDPVNGASAPNTRPCPRCGKQIPADAIFCGECGYRMDAAPADNAYAAPACPAADTSPLKTSDYVILHLLNMVPLLGLILMLVWSFSEGGNINRRNFCRAYLIMYAISFVLSIFLVIIYALIFALMFQAPTASANLFEAFGMIFR